MRSGVLASLLTRTTVHVHNSLFAVISCLIRTELVTFGWFVVDTLGGGGGIVVGEVPPGRTTPSAAAPPSQVAVEDKLTKRIVIRNKCLQLLHTCLYTGKTLNVGFCDDVIQTLGFDFVLLFCSPHLHPDTLVWAMRILMLLLNSSGSNKNKFRDGVSTNLTITFVVNGATGR